MKKTTKGALAAVVGGSLMFGGAGSLAYWNGEQTVTGNDISSGTFTLGAPDCTVAVGTHEWQYDGGSTFTPASSKIVPGDVITKVCQIPLTLVGDHIGADLGVDPVAWTASNGLTAQLTPTADFTVGGNPVTDAITAPGNYVILAQISVEFTDETAADNTSQTLTAALEDIVVTATQTHDTAA